MVIGKFWGGLDQRQYFYIGDSEINNNISCRMLRNYVVNPLELGEACCFEFVGNSSSVRSSPTRLT